MHIVCIEVFRDVITSALFLNKTNS